MPFQFKKQNHRQCSTVGTGEMPFTSQPAVVLPWNALVVVGRIRVAKCLAHQKTQFADKALGTGMAKYLGNHGSRKPRFPRWTDGQNAQDATLAHRWRKVHIVGRPGVAGCFSSNSNANAPMAFTTSPSLMRVRPLRAPGTTDLAAAKQC